MWRVLLSVCSMVVPAVAFAQSPDPAGESAPAPAGDEAAVRPAEPGGPAESAAPVTAVVDAQPAAVTASSKYSGVDAPPPAAARLVLSDLTVFRLNPLGLETRARIGVQKRL